MNETTLSFGILAAFALVFAFIALLVVRNIRADLQDRIVHLEQDLGLLTVSTEEDAVRTGRLWQELNQTKHRINADLVQHNHRLNRHQAYLANDHLRIDVLSENIRDLRVAEQENRDHLNQLEQDHP